MQVHTLEYDTAKALPDQPGPQGDRGALAAVVVWGVAR